MSAQNLPKTPYFLYSIDIRMYVCLRKIFKAIKEIESLEKYMNL